MKLCLLCKNVFGIDRYYPFDSLAKTIIRVMNKKTFNPEHIKIFREDGWEVDIKYHD